MPDQLSGCELDRAIERAVFRQSRTIPCVYATSIMGAWCAVEHLARQGWRLSLVDQGDEWRAEFSRPGRLPRPAPGACTRGDGFVYVIGRGETAPESICRAGLQVAALADDPEAEADHAK